MSVEAELAVHRAFRICKGVETMSKLDELRKQREELEAQIKAAEEEEQREHENAVLQKIDAITPEMKEAILSIMKHDRTSCSDDNPCNGYSYIDGRYRCRKCMLMEILRGDHGGQFDFDLTVEISEV